MKVDVPVARIGIGALPVTVKMRVYYSMYHYWSALHFASLAGQLEGTGQIPRFDIKHRAYVTGSLLATVSFLESTINELLKDAADLAGQSSLLDQRVVQEYANLWKDERRLGIVRKYQLALEIAGCSPLPGDDTTLGNVSALLALRNVLVHYKPETLGDNDPHPVADCLKERFAPNKLMEGSGNPFFPDHCLGHGCCDWAISSARSFVEECLGRLEVAPKYRAVPWPDPAA
jgi:hypothetical protein